MALTARKNNMHRLFIALRPPSAIRNALIDTTEGVEGARWQFDEQLHLTLRFAGEVDAWRQIIIFAALASIVVGALGATDEFRAAGIGPVSRRRSIMLLGGLRELTAITVEEGGRMGDVTEEAVDASIALLSPHPH